MGEAVSSSRIHISRRIDEVEDLIGSYRTAGLSCVQTTAGKLGARVHGLATRRAELREVSFDAGIVLTIHDPVPRFGLAIALAGETRVLGQPLTSSNLGFLSGRNGMIARLKPGSRWCNVALDWNLVFQVAETHGYRIPTGDSSRALPPERHDRLAALLSAMARRQLMSETGDAELEDELVRSCLRELNPDRRSGREWRLAYLPMVRRVIEFIQAEYANPVTVTGLCALVGVSERTLQYRFRETTGFTVQQYLMKYRLHRAHALLTHGEYTRIGEVAHAVGIHHPGRFSEYYRRLFGHHPRKSLAGSGASQP